MSNPDTCPFCGSENVSRAVHKHADWNAECKVRALRDFDDGEDDGPESNIIGLVREPTDELDAEYEPVGQVIFDEVLGDVFGEMTMERLATLDEYFDGVGFKAVLTVLITEAYMDRKAMFLEAGEGE